MSQIVERENLFREEAVEAQVRRLHGEVILKQSVSTLIVTGLITAIVGGAILWATLGHYARVESARGVLVPEQGYSKVFALRPGVITDLLVKDGDQVKAGQRLAIVQMELPSKTGILGSKAELGSINNQSALAQSQVALAGERSSSEVSRLTGTIEGLQQELAKVIDQTALQEQIVRSMGASLEQVKPVVDKGFISKLDYERRRQALLSAEEDLSRLQQQTTSVKSEIAKTEKERSQAVLSGRNDQTNAKAALENLQQQKIKAEGEESYALEAPVAGRVTGIQTSPGRTVDGSMPLLVIIPDNAPLRANLYVPSRAIGFIRKGQEVRLLYDAFPYERFGTFAAHVDTISRLAVAGQESDAPFKIEEPVYKITATLDRQKIRAYGEPITLQSGMTLVGDIVLERQSFLDWILDPVRAASKRN